MKKLRLQRNLLLLITTVSLFSHILYGLETDRQIAFLNNKIEGQAKELLEKQEEIELLEAIIRNKEKDASNLKSIGTYTITHYCIENYPHICNDGESLKTASGQAPIPYYTVAADKSIPFGTKLVIDSKEFEVMDRGGAITTKRIDIAVQTHAETMELGKVQKQVYLVN